MATILGAALATGAAGGAAATSASLFTLGNVMTGISVLSGVASGISSMNQADAQEDQARLQARAEEVNGRMRAIAVNEELLKTLSRNNAVAAASGLQSSGSVARANEAAQRKAAEELNINRFNTETQKTALTQKATSASNVGKNVLAGSLFDAVETSYGAYKKIKETK